MNTKTTVLQTQPLKPVPSVAGTPLSTLMPPPPAEVTPKVVVKTGPAALP